MDLFRVCAITYDVESKCSHLYFIGGEVKCVSLDPKSILDRMCMLKGSSMQGRMDACKYVLQIQRKVPVLVSRCLECIFFPINGFMVEDNIWLQYKYIQKVKSVTTSKCIVYFVDGSELLVPVGCRVVYKQLQRCKKFFSVITSGLDSREIIGEEV